MLGVGDSVKSLTEFENYLVNRKKRVGSSTNLLSRERSFSSLNTSFRPSVAAKAPPVDNKVLTAKHGMQLSNKIIRFHPDSNFAIGHLNRRVKRSKPSK